MRTLPPELAAALESEAATLCTAWILTRTDGVRLGFTDHDAPLAIEGLTCEAASGWTAGAADAALGLDAGQASAAGALSSDALTEADIAAGLYDGAVAETWRVDWSAPAARVRLRRETVSRLVRTGEGFTAELEGPLAALKTVVGRAYDRVCDAQLGDARCCRTSLRPTHGPQFLFGVLRKRIVSERHSQQLTVAERAFGSTHIRGWGRGEMTHLGHWQRPLVGREEGPGCHLHRARLAERHRLARLGGSARLWVVLESNIRA